jgi:hypothetical protein
MPLPATPPSVLQIRSGAVTFVWAIAVAKAGFPDYYFASLKLGAPAAHSVENYVDFFLGQAQENLSILLVRRRQFLVISLSPYF